LRDPQHDSDHKDIVKEGATMTIEIQHAFVWTKIKDYSGQGMRLILNRKELERQSGGTFWWGIGESKTDKIMLLAGREGRPTVVFSEMPTSAHRRDSSPDGVLLWEQTKDKKSLPPHVLLMSRAHQSNGRMRDRYYVLVCENPVGIPHSGGGVLHTGTL